MVKKKAENYEYDGEAGRIGHNISDCMKNTKTTVDMLAAILGISNDEVRCYIDGLVIPEPKILEKMSTYFKIPVKQICGDETIYSSFGEELKNLRKAAGFTLSDTSEYTGIHLSSISKIESGSINLTEDHVKKLSECFGDVVRNLVKKYRIAVRKSRAPRKANKKQEEIAVQEEHKSEEKDQQAVCNAPDAIREEVSNSIAFKKEWIPLVFAIDSDKEFRAIATYILSNLSGESVDIDFKSMPQANLVKKLVDLK